MKCTGCLGDFEPFDLSELCYSCTVKALTESRKREGVMRDALAEVLAHKAVDKDGNHVMWIGEGTMLRCEQSVSTDRPAVWTREELGPLVEALLEIENKWWVCVDTPRKSARQAIDHARKIGLIKEETK